MQGGLGSRPVRRWDSWVDQHLVIRKGENLLRDLDTWAIPVLRAQKLVWSGWAGTPALQGEHTILDEEGRGYRRVNVTDPPRFRLFLMSLLWRAAASDLGEMSEVVLPQKDIEALGSMLRNNDPGPLSFYPAQIIQLSTKGQIHNQTPFADVKSVPSFVADIPPRSVRLFRFYFDGLVVHFHDQRADDGYTADLGNLVVGASASLDVATVPYEISFQAENLRAVMNDTEARFPEIVRRLAPRDPEP